MNTSLTASQAHARASAPPTRRVVDAPTRVFHALLALSFVGAYLTAEGESWRQLHITLGYTMAGLLTFRVVWGLFGPRHVRLAVLGRKLQGWPAWLQGLKAGQAPGRPLQNLLLASSVAGLLGLIAPLALSGYGVYQDWAGDWLADVHALFGNAMLAVVLGHVGLIGWLSLARRHNMAGPMLTGHAPGPGPDVARRNHGALALLLLVAVLGFWAWQWQQAPAGTDVVRGAAQANPDAQGRAQRRHHDHDD
jgi:cytochrome b